jgi:hypothetical protein
MGRTSSMNKADISTYRILIGQPECKIPIGGLKHRSEDNIKTGLS